MSCQVIGMMCCYVANLMATCTWFCLDLGTIPKCPITCLSYLGFLQGGFSHSYLCWFRSLEVPFPSDQIVPPWIWLQPSKLCLGKRTGFPHSGCPFCVFFGVVRIKATHEAFPSSNHKIYHLSHNQFCPVISPYIIVYHLISPYIPIVGCLKSLSTLSTTLLKTPQGHKDPQKTLYLVVKSNTFSIPSTVMTQLISYKSVK